MNPSFLLVLIFFSIGEFTNNEEIPSSSPSTNCLKLIKIDLVSKKDIKAFLKENKIAEIETERFLICANAMNIKRHRYKYRHAISYRASSLLSRSKNVIYVYANNMSDYLFALHFDNVFKILGRPFFEVKKTQLLFNATAVYIEMLQQSTADSYLMYYAVLGKIGSSKFRSNFKNFFALALLLHLVENSSTERLIELCDFFRALYEDKSFDYNLGKLIKCICESATRKDPNVPNVRFIPAIYNIPITAILYQTYFRSRCYNAESQQYELITYDSDNNKLNCAFKLVGKIWEQIANNKCMQKTLSVIYQIEFYNRIRKITQELQQFTEMNGMDAIIFKSFKPLVLLIDDFKGISSSLTVTRFLCRQNLTVFNEFTQLLTKIIDTVENVDILNCICRCAIRYMKFYRYQLFTFCYDMLSEMFQCRNADDRKRITNESRQVLESFTYLTTISDMICKLKERISVNVQNNVGLSKSNEKSHFNGISNSEITQDIACNSSRMSVNNSYQNIETDQCGYVSIGQSFENGNSSTNLAQTRPLPSFSSFVQDNCSLASFSVDAWQISMENTNINHSFEFSLFTNDCISRDSSDTSNPTSHSNSGNVGNPSNPAFINLPALDNFNNYSELTIQNIQLAFNSVFICPIIQNEFKTFTNQFQHIQINQPFLQQFRSSSSIYKLIRGIDEVYGLPVARNDNLLAYFKVIANVDTQLSRILMEMVGNEQNYSNKHKLPSANSQEETGKKEGYKGRRKKFAKNADLQVDEVEVKKFCERLMGFLFYQVIDTVDP